jgi:GxxExxY protein
MHKPLTYAINGCLFKVYNAIGNIWSEDVYEKALESELRSQGLAVQRQKEFEVFYFDKRVGRYRTDLLVEDTVIVELKAVSHLLPGAFPASLSDKIIKSKRWIRWNLSKTRRPPRF